MAQSEYVFHRVEDKRELERLRMIELVFDPASRKRLLATGLQIGGWLVLEEPDFSASRGITGDEQELLDSLILSDTAGLRTIQIPEPSTTPQLP